MWRVGGLWAEGGGLSSWVDLDAIIYFSLLQNRGET